MILGHSIGYIRSYKVMEGQGKTNNRYAAQIKDIEEFELGVMGGCWWWPP